MFNLLWQDVFVKVHEENLASHRHVAGKGILIAFPNYYFLFDTTPKKWFLTGGCSMESETTSTDFSYCYIKIQIRILHTLNGSFTQEWFCFIMYWSFEEYWFTNLCRSSKCSHISFCIMRKKITFDVITDLILKVWILETIKLTVLEWISFPKF